MKGRRTVAAVILVALGAGIGVGVAALVDGNDDEQASPPRPTAVTTTTVERPDPRVNPAAAELYDLVNGFSGVTLHATYRVVLTDRPEANSVIEIWQKSGHVRQDATIEQAGTGTSRLTILNLEDRIVFCQQPPRGQYTCGLVPEAQATAFDAIRANLVAEIRGQQIKVHDANIGGRDVRCFTVETGTAGELCATPEGVLVRITAQEGSFELIDLETDVDDAVFTPPAIPGE